MSAHSPYSPTSLRRRSTHFAPDYPPSRQPLPSIHWLFRTNIPRRRSSYLPPDIHKRNLFGMTEILGVIANPAETVRSLTESRRLLEEARREVAEHNERSQLPPKHNFTRLPGFFPRKAEMLVIERMLEREPSFTIVFGASSTGKTALLREVLSREQYHVLHFDLRIPGFADLPSLYVSLSQQMELYFEEIAKTMDGYVDFQKEAWSFKHSRLDVERRMSEEQKGAKCTPVMTSDIARLMELFQSSLLKYWQFHPSSGGSENPKSPSRRLGSEDTDRTLVEPTPARRSPTGRLRSIISRNKKHRARQSMPPRSDEPTVSSSENGKAKEQVKKIPVIFFDEAHRLPGLIQSNAAMKCLFDSMLVLTKQDRLCHVIHSTSDPFYQTWLRQLNVMQDCRTITIGDCSKSETRRYYRDQVLSRVPERLRPGLNFEVLYDAFGGKVAHWHDYVTDYVNCGGRLDIRQSSHFLQAHSLLNLHIIHSSQSPGAQEAAITAQAANTSNPETLHPGLGPAGFKAHSYPTGVGCGSSNGNGAAADETDRQNTLVAGVYASEFTAMQLLKVMSRLTKPETEYVPYFLLCRELGVRAVDGMVKGRLLDLRWTEPVTREGVSPGRHIHDEGVSLSMSMTTRARSGVSLNAVPPLRPALSPLVPPLAPLPGLGRGREEGSTTALSTPVSVPVPQLPNSAVMGSEIGEMGLTPLSEHAYLPPAMPSRDPYDDEEEVEVVGPKLVPTTPIMKYAMRDVVREYEDDGSASEYASLSDVDEY